MLLNVGYFYMNNKKQKIVPNSECILSFSSEKLVLESSISIN